jgi:hypothetical protein
MCAPTHRVQALPAALLLLLLCACGAAAEVITPDAALTPGCVSSTSSPTTDFFPAKLSFAGDTQARAEVSTRGDLRARARAGAFFSVLACACVLTLSPPPVAVSCARRPAQVSVAQYFTVTYHGYYKYVRDLRASPDRVYVLYQVRQCFRIPAAAHADAAPMAPPRGAPSGAPCAPHGARTARALGLLSRAAPPGALGARVRLPRAHATLELAPAAACTHMHAVCA